MLKIIELIIFKTVLIAETNNLFKDIAPFSGPKKPVKFE